MILVGQILVLIIGITQVQQICYLQLEPAQILIRLAINTSPTSLPLAQGSARWGLTQAQAQHKPLTAASLGERDLCLSSALTALAIGTFGTLHAAWCLVLTHPCCSTAQRLKSTPTVFTQPLAASRSSALLLASTHLAARTSTSPSHKENSNGNQNS